MRRVVRTVGRRDVHDGLEEPRRERGAAELHDDVTRDAPPREVAPQRERDADRRVQVRARHLAHEQDDRQHHQARRHDRSGAADRVRERLAHHPAAGRDEHEEERAEQLGEEASPFLRRILEVLHRFLERLESDARRTPQCVSHSPRSIDLSVSVVLMSRPGDSGACHRTTRSLLPPPSMRSLLFRDHLLASSGNQFARNPRRTLTTWSSGMAALGSFGRPSISRLCSAAYSRIPGQGLAHDGEHRAESGHVLLNLRHRPRIRDGPCLGVARGVEGEDVGERPGGSVARRERVSQTPLLAQRGDQRRVAVLLVEHLAFGDPWRHDDGGDPVAGAVEREAELAGRGRRVRARHRRRRDVVIGAARLVPADQQRRVPDVGAGRGPASPCRRCRSVRGTPRRPGSTTAGRRRARPRRAPKARPNAGW